MNETIKKEITKFVARHLKENAQLVNAESQAFVDSLERISRQTPSVRVQHAGDAMVRLNGIRAALQAVLADHRLLQYLAAFTGDGAQRFDDTVDLDIDLMREGYMASAEAAQGRVSPERRKALEAAVAAAMAYCDEQGERARRLL